MLAGMHHPLRREAPEHAQAHAVEDVGRVRDRDQQARRRRPQRAHQLLRQRQVLEHLARHDAIELVPGERLTDDVAAVGIHSPRPGEGHRRLRHVDGHDPAAPGGPEILGEGAVAAADLENPRAGGDPPGEDQRPAREPGRLTARPPVPLVVEAAAGEVGAANVPELREVADERLPQSPAERAHDGALISRRHPAARAPGERGRGAG